jgi:uncharacterized LabA/DUF88 family protein
MTKVNAYVDGFNLYFGLKSKGWKRYYWLNIQKLIQNLLKPDQVLNFTKYFTARITKTVENPEKHKRQKIYLEALCTLDNFQIIYGHYLPKERSCKKCNWSWTTYEEKMTDVNIAVELIKDTFHNSFDTAILISGDSDLVGPINTIHNLFPSKRIVVAFPPDRHSKHLKKVGDANFTISRKKLADSIFEDKVLKSDGYLLHRPDKWR